MATDGNDEYLVFDEAETKDYYCEPASETSWGNRIIVPLDGSSEATEALPVARALADLLCATIHVIHVSDTALKSREMPRLLGLTPEDLTGIIVEEATGPPADAILTIEQLSAHSPVVMSARAGATPPDQAAGPIALDIVQRSSNPVLVVWPGQPSHIGEEGKLFRRIVLPLDGTPSTAFAIAPAINLAERSKADLLILYVAAPGRQRRPEPGTLTAPRYLDQPQHEWADWSAELLERVWQVSGYQPTKIPVRMAMAVGEPIEEITKYAAEHQADLLAFAWHGRFIRGLPSAILSHLRGAGCPLLVLHAAPRPHAAEEAEGHPPPRGRERRKGP